MAKESKSVKEVFLEKNGVTKYFNELSAAFNAIGLDYDKAVDHMFSGMKNVPEGKFRAVKAFLVKDGDSNILDVNSSGDVFAISAFCAMEELVNEYGEDMDTKNASIVLMAFDVPLEEVPDQLLFGENKESFYLVMKDYSSKEITDLAIWKLESLKTEMDAKTGRISIREIKAKADKKEFEVKLK